MPEKRQVTITIANNEINNEIYGTLVNHCEERNNLYNTGMFRYAQHDKGSAIVILNEVKNLRITDTGMFRYAQHDKGSTIVILNEVKNLCITETASCLAVMLTLLIFKIISSTFSFSLFIH